MATKASPELEVAAALSRITTCGPFRMLGEMSCDGKRVSSVHIVAKLPEACRVEFLAPVARQVLMIEGQFWIKQGTKGPLVPLSKKFGQAAMVELRRELDALSKGSSPMSRSARP